MNTVMLNKEHPEIPDFYTLEIEFLVGGSKKYEVVGHRFPLNETCIELLLKSEDSKLIPFSSIKELSFGKDLIEYRKLEEKVKSERK